MSLLIRWASSATALYLITLFVPGVSVTGITATLLAALVIGLINATLGNLLKMLTFPIGCITLGISRLIINALMFWLASALISGFHVTGFFPALLGSIALAVVSTAVDFLLTLIFTSDKKDKND
ncbi:MAG: phage holin family protein [Bryobacter sp.]|jgi:putative membrane protein|nr:phage holin family protein [Bryobacter sp. CoA8 C33]